MSFNTVNNQHLPNKCPAANIWSTPNMHPINLSKTSIFRCLTNKHPPILSQQLKKFLLTHKPACHIMLLPIRLHIHMWVVYLHMFHADIQLKAYMLSNFHQTNHQSTYKNYQTMSFSASCALCQMVNNSNSRNYKAMKLSRRLVNRFDRIRQDNFSFMGIKKGSVILCFTIEQ